MRLCLRLSLTRCLYRLEILMSENAHDLDSRQTRTLRLIG